jgi:hypothetical protein
VIIRWSVTIKDEEGVEKPMNYEISFNPEDIEGAIASKKISIREATEHLATYRKIKADDPLLASHESCPICQDAYEAGQFKRVLQKCNHTFHKKCVDKWFVSNPNLECPMCRTKHSKDCLNSKE